MRTNSHKVRSCSLIVLITNPSWCNTNVTTPKIRYLINAALSKVRYASRNRIFRSFDFPLMLLLSFQGSYQVYTLLDWADRSYLVIDFHGLQSNGLICIHSWSVFHRLVEKFSFILVQKFVALTSHIIEVILPALTNLKVLLMTWRRLWFFRNFVRHSGLKHNFFHIGVRLWKVILFDKFFGFCYMSRVDIYDAR